MPRSLPWQRMSHHGNKRLQETSRQYSSLSIGRSDCGLDLIGQQSDLAGASTWGEGAKLCESGQ